METWPAELPQYTLVDGYGESEADNLLEYTTDKGPPIGRPLSSSAARELDIALELSKDDLVVLRTFGRVTLMEYSLPFILPAPSKVGTYDVKFRKGGQPKLTGQGGRWFRVSCGLWILP